VGSEAKQSGITLVAFRLLQLAFIFLLFENIAGKLRNDENSAVYIIISYFGAFVTVRSVAIVC
jgi:hypothetical protein